MNSRVIDKKALWIFITRIQDFNSLKPAELIDYFLYFLNVEQEISDCSAMYIKECFLLLRLTPYSNIPNYLNDNLKSKKKEQPKFFKVKNGFVLHRSVQEKLATIINKNIIKVKVSTTLRSLLNHINNNNENEFLNEAIKCFEIDAYRASIIMVWNLTIDHLFEYTLQHVLSDFNEALSKNTDKRIKINSIIKKDDFNEIPENKFLEFCKSANIISSDVRKILDVKLGIRNTCAHPSNVKVLESKAYDFIEDLINNVVLKFII